MIEEVFHIGKLSISPFGPMLVVALFAAYWQLRWGMRRLGIGNEEDASAIVFACGLGGIIGGKIYFAILYHDWHLLLDRAGIVWYGSFVLGLATFLWTIRRRRLPFAGTFDAALAALPLGYGLGRIGCFLVGDDYGKPTDLPWGIEFRVGLPRTTAGNLRDHFGIDLPPSIADNDWIAVHPTQLYELALGLAIWGVALWLFRRRLRPGTVALATLALMSCERFGIEFLRAKDDRFFGPFTLAQAFSVATLVVVAVIAWRRHSQAPPAGAPEEERSPKPAGKKGRKS
ncbi:MAG: prolipoprotein diacylglyceryl transferase [bacterium]|nr:prolipoprotein diacylglyceryl transferase [bacterium]